MEAPMPLEGTPPLNENVVGGRPETVIEVTQKRGEVQPGSGLGTTQDPTGSVPVYEVPTQPLPVVSTENSSSQATSTAPESVKQKRYAPIRSVGYKRIYGSTKSYY